MRTITLKVLKLGGLIRTQKIATIAEAAGLRCYENTSLETPIGPAPGLHLFSTVPNLAEWCELFGPLLLAGYVVKMPLQFRDFHVWLPKGPRLGAALDEEKMDHYGRASS